MTLRRTLHRTIAFDCDGCSTSLDTEKFDLARAGEVMKAKGWRARKDGDAWRHSCPPCAPAQLF